MIKYLIFFVDNANKVKFDDDEIHQMIEGKDLQSFLEYNMQKFAASTGYPVFHTVLLILNMERFTNKKAHEILKENIYYRRKDYTEKVLAGLMDNGTIIKCDVEKVTMEYYYALSGILDEYVQLVAWREDIDEISRRISDHMLNYVELLSAKKR